VSHEHWDGAQFAQALHMATRHIEVHRAYLDGLNVFPVPDGDTGTNLVHTLRGITATLPASGTIDVMAQALADSALEHGRGNSGIILAQALRGLAQVLARAPLLAAAELAAGLRAASLAADAAVAAPIDGTMLSGIRAAAAALDPVPVSLAAALERAWQAAQQAVARSPQQLAVLREAGVVDAGAHGWALLLEAWAALAHGRPLAATAPPPPRLRRTTAIEVGYCVNLVIVAADITPEQVQHVLAPLGDSLAIAGTAPRIRVHLHTAQPGQPLAAAAALGELDRIEIQNMAQQCRQRLRHADDRPLGLVAAVAGDGFATLLGELGATVVPDGVAGDAAIADVLLTRPTQPTIVLGERCAAWWHLGPGPIAWVPCATPAHALVAALAYDAHATLAEAAATMRTALARVAIASIEVIGQRALLVGPDGTTTDDLVAALFDGAAVHAWLDDAELVSIYTGATASPSEVQRLCAAIARHRAAPRVVILDGGQAAPRYLIAIE